jgi:hypothetical protein
MWNTLTSPLTLKWYLWPNTCSTTGEKGPSLSKEPALIPCKSPLSLLTLKRRLKIGGDTIAYKVHN